MKKFFISLGIILIILVALFSYGMYHFWSAKEVPLTEADELLLVSPHDLVEYFEGFEVQDEFIALSKKKYLNGAEELLLEYKTESDDQPYLSVGIDREMSEKDVSFGYTAVWQGFKIGLNLGNDKFHIREVPDFLSLGDASRVGAVYYADAQVGNVIVIRAGLNIYSLIILGFYFDDPDIVSDLLATRIATLQEDVRGE